MTEPETATLELNAVAHNWRRDLFIMASFCVCVTTIGAIAGSCIFHVPQEWQLPKDVITILGTLASNLLTGYFALQIGSARK